MFNWLKKSDRSKKVVSAEKIAHEPKVVVSQNGNTTTQLAISESAVLRDQGNAHIANGKLEEATVCFRQAIVLNPSYAEAYTNLGIVLQMQGNLNGAITLYRKAVEFKPSLLPAHLNLGMCFINLGQGEAAEESFRRVTDLAPEHANASQHAAALQSLGVLAAQRGDFSHAESLLRKALELQPNDADTHFNLGSLLMEARRLPEAEAYFQHALKLKPDYAEASNNLGIVLKFLGQFDNAVASYRRAIEIKPDYAQAHSNLGNILQDMGRLDESEVSLRRALEIRPDYAQSHNNLGVTLMGMGRFDEAVANYRRAIGIKPDYAVAYNNMLLAMQYSKSYTQAELLAEHLAYAQVFEAPLKKQWPAYPNSCEPGKRLKVGYVSADFRNHSVAYFIESVFAHHDREQIEIYCYYNAPIFDEVTLHLKSLAEHWCDINAMGDEEAAMQIRNDGIDILVDLAGHTAGNRLRTFARKPAPVQVSWLGYPSTTGLSSIGYRISDIYADPVGMSERYYSETLYRLPATSTCYYPPHPSPEINNLPAFEQGGITFGSFNNLTKVTSEVCALWARILLVTPNSRLMLKANALKGRATQQRLIAEFAKHGIAKERLVLTAQDATHFEHLDRYNKVDIGLDPFPYNGVTTSFEAMWMGVPVVSMNGNSYVSRMGVSILSNLGLTELLADTPEDYVTIATILACDTERLAKLRSRLRERMTNSLLTNGKLFTLDLEKAYREMWLTFVAKKYQISPMSYPAPPPATTWPIQKTETLLIEGWRGINHSYALVNQNQLIQF